MRDILISMFIKYEGSQKKVYKALKEKEPFSENQVNSYKMSNDFDEYVTVLDEDYPQELKSEFNPPIVFKRADFLNIHNSYADGVDVWD